MTDGFFKSDLVVEELEDIQQTYTDLLKMSAGLSDFSPQERLDHIEKTLELIAKQKVFYSRLALASHGVDPETEDEDAKYIKDRIDTMSQNYSGGMNLMMILQTMEDKLQTWRREIKDAES
tara:strand:+ start:258 stop:620 length:363 start_codon:yes stop_codon:yes gene_type:complete